MPSSLLRNTVFFLSLSVANIFAQSNNEAPVGRVECGFSGLSQWYEISTGIWETAGWWNGANILTTAGDAAIAQPHNARLQLLVRRTFANAVRKAPARNPDLGRETPKNETTESSKVARLGTSYSKYMDTETWQPRSSYPANWWRSNKTYASYDDTVLLVRDPQYDEATLLADFTPNPYDFLDGYYDDDLWWCLAWLTAYDLTKNRIYLQLAEGIFAAVASTWSTNCGSGGVYWNYNRTYVNAITNELFFSSAAHLANRADNATYYKNWAQDSLDWFMASGMLNAEGTINDGLDAATCKNNNGTVWSYNQGVILGGLVELHRAAPDDDYLLIALYIAKAALYALKDAKGVIHDPCEKTRSCGADGTQFKGIFMRNLAKLQKETGDWGLRCAITANADSIWTEAREGTVFGNNWAGPFEGPGNASVQGSAMDALVGAVRIR
ncbi:glycosyl hydrolase family 76-domain-containing protein [Phaeosphaeria sp. MPI-PUGE-AT-0046c]|nr:glycosyl hydrolase family 76-domain-containing protein [Phaeosphaeria sp. MPI-PUGE-AT-0046c]